MSSQVYTSSKTNLIHSTTSYDQFRFDPTNRPIDQNHLERLHDAICKKNLLQEFPILVQADGTVLDGQHRLKVAQSLGVPIYYIISTNMVVDDVQATNATTLRWKIKDVLTTFVAKGYPEYVKLMEFTKAHPWMPLNAAMGLCTYGDRSMSSEVFKSGNYVCNDLEFAGIVANAVLDFKQYCNFYRHPLFIQSVAMLFEHEEYDHARMMAKMDYMSRKLVKCPDMTTYMAMFSDIYNFRTYVENRMTFEKLASNSKKRREDRKMRNLKAKQQ